MSRRDTGAKQKYIWYLDSARIGEHIRGATGRFIQIVDASSANATIEVALGANNSDSEYQKLTDQGFIFDQDGFDGLFLRNDAQAGEWVKVVITENKDDYQVENPALNNINAITNDVPLDDAALIAAIQDVELSVDELKAMLQNDTAQRMGANVVGGTYDSGTASGDNTLIDGTTDNPAGGNGVIIRTLGVYIQNNGQIVDFKIGGNKVTRYTSNSSAGKAPAGIDLTLPLVLAPGEALVATHSDAACESYVTWDAI